MSFHRVAVDFIGPLQPATNRDNCYILTLEDFLLGIKKLSYSIQRECQKHLLHLFCWIGVPEQMWRIKVLNLGQNWWQKHGRLPTQYPEALALITERVSEALITFFFVESGFQNKCCRIKVLNLDQNWWQKQVDVNFSCWRLRCVTISSNDSIEHLNRYYMYAVYVLKDRLALEQVSISSFICKQ